MEPTALILNRDTWFFQRWIYNHLNKIFKLKIEIIIMLELYETLSSCGNDIHNWNLCYYMCGYMWMLNSHHFEKSLQAQHMLSYEDSITVLEYYIQLPMN